MISMKEKLHDQLRGEASFDDGVKAALAKAGVASRSKVTREDVEALGERLATLFQESTGGVVGIKSRYCGGDGATDVIAHTSKSTLMLFSVRFDGKVTFHGADWRGWSEIKDVPELEKQVVKVLEYQAQKIAKMAEEAQ
jgi:hypothetical protein